MFSILSKFSLSKLTLFLMSVIFIYSFFTIKIWKQKTIIEQDVLSYYGYLPATFIYHDLTLSSIFNGKENSLIQVWAKPFPNRGRAIKMSMGLSYMYSPFFFIAHYIAAPKFGYPQDGFCRPYQKMLAFSSLFYVFIGLILLRKILLRYFSELITSITLILIFFATNLKHYTFIEGPMSHSYNFFLLSAFLYLTLSFLKKPKFLNSILLGLTYGLIVLIRPSNASVLILSLLIGVYSLKDFKNHLFFLSRNYKFILLSILCSIIIWIPQFLYWHKITGNYLYYSYTHEKFYFNHPHIIEGLFGFRKGWIIYTPIMLFAILGFFFLKRKSNDLFLPIISFTIINLFVIFSWWCWWYGGSYGARAMIDSYALMAFPIAAFFDFSFKRTTLLIPILLLTGAFISLNIFQSKQYQTSLLHWDSMTYETYKSIFLHKDFHKGYGETLKNPDYQNALRGLPERDFSATYPFLKRNFDLNVKIKAFNGKYVSVDQSKGYCLVADRINAGSWEAIEFDMEKPGVFTLTGWNRKFISIDSSYNNRIIANKDSSSVSETFTINILKNNKFAFKGSNGKYLKPDSLNNYILDAVSDTITTENEFEITSY